MALLADTQIASAGVTALGGLPSSGDRVYLGRTRPLPERHAPLLLVYGLETVSRLDGQGEVAEYLHEMQLFIEGHISRAAADADEDVSRALEEQLGVIKLEVVGRLLRPGALGLKIEAIMLRRSTLSARAPGTRHEGEIRIEFGVRFRTPENDFTAFV